MAPATFASAAAETAARAPALQVLFRALYAHYAWSTQPGAALARTADTSYFNGAYLAATAQAGAQRQHCEQSDA